MKSYKDALTQPPLTNDQARAMAVRTLKQVDEYERRLFILQQALDYAYLHLADEHKKHMTTIITNGLPLHE